jgi:hypothetical protein
VYNAAYVLRTRGLVKCDRLPGKMLSYCHFSDRAYPKSIFHDDTGVAWLTQWQKDPIAVARVNRGFVVCMHSKSDDVCPVLSSQVTLDVEKEKGLSIRVRTD